MIGRSAVVFSAIVASCVVASPTQFQKESSMAYTPSLYNQPELMEALSRHYESQEPTGSDDFAPEVGAGVDRENRNLDSIGGGNLVRNLDSIGDGNLIRRIQARNLDGVNGGQLSRSLYNRPPKLNTPIVLIKSIRLSEIPYSDSRSRGTLDHIGGGNLLR